MADQLKQIIALSSKRYNENRATRPGLARAHLATINRADDLRLEMCQWVLDTSGESLV
jgi:hypothetical protein